jgi:hypothetical protein
MSKLKLALEELKVESFETMSPKNLINGTIKANAVETYNGEVIPACYDLETYFETCPNTCLPTCYNTCNGAIQTCDAACNVTFDGGLTCDTCMQDCTSVTMNACGQRCS